MHQFAGVPYQECTRAGSCAEFPLSYAPSTVGTPCIVAASVGIRIGAFAQNGRLSVLVDCLSMDKGT